MWHKSKHKKIEKSWKTMKIRIKIKLKKGHNVYFSITSVYEITIKPILFLFHIYKFWGEF